VIACFPRVLRPVDDGGVVEEAVEDHGGGVLEDFVSFGLVVRMTEPCP
jgi:hypothetical protein